MDKSFGSGTVSPHLITYEPQHQGADVACTPGWAESPGTLPAVGMFYPLSRAA